MTQIQPYDMGDYYMYPVNPNCATVVPKPIPQPVPHQTVQQNNNSATPHAPTPQPRSIKWEKLGVGMLIGLGAIALFNYLPVPMATAPTPVIDPAVVRDLDTQNKMLQQYVRNLESQLLLQSGRTCP